MFIHLFARPFKEDEFAIKEDVRRIKKHLKQTNKKIQFIEMLATSSNIKLALSLNPDILHITSHGKEDHLCFELGYDGD